MRYYRLEIIDENGKTPVDDTGTPIGPFDTSKTPGRGLDIEFDALIAGYDVVSSGTMVVIYGLPVSMIRQSVQLRGCSLRLYAGFTSGLPLENALQAGLIIRGEIYNPYANWIGTHQSLNLIVNPEPLLNDVGQINSITLNGREGEKLSDALRRAITSAYPKMKVDITISDALVLAESGVGVYSRLSQLASSMRSQSISFINTREYSGVQIVIQQDTIRVFDNSSVNAGGVEILPHELIGQPTWMSLVTVSFKCPLRSDLRCGDTVVLPANIISGPSSLLSVNSGDSYASVRNTVNFTGRFLITSVRHVGRYLSPDSSSAWVTIYEAIATR